MNQAPAKYVSNPYKKPGFDESNPYKKPGLDESNPYTR